MCFNLGTRPEQSLHAILTWMASPDVIIETAVEVVQPGCEEFLVTCGPGGSFPSLPFCRRPSMLALFQGLHFKTMVLRSSKSWSVLPMWVLNASLRVEGLLSSFCPFSSMLINIVCVLYQHLQILLEGALQFAKLSVFPGLVFARDTVSGNRRRGPFLCPSCLYTCHPPAGTGDTRQSQKMVKKNFCSLSSRDFSPRPSVLCSVIFALLPQA